MLQRSQQIILRQEKSEFESWQYTFSGASKDQNYTGEKTEKVKNNTSECSKGSC